MSDFEEKYNKLFDEHKALESEKAELENSFAEEKQKLEDSVSEKAAQYSDLKADFDELESNYEELKVKAKELSDEFEKIQEEKLSGLRAQVTELNAEMKGILKEEDINSFSENTLNFWVEQYETQKKNIEAEPIKKPLKGTNQYSEEPKQTENPIEGLLDYVSKL